MGEIKTIIFDMDGVLVDAKEWHYESLNRALMVHGYHIDRAAHLATFNGLPTARKLEILTLKAGLPRDLYKPIMELKQTYTQEMIRTRCKPIVEHQRMVARLKAEGFRLAVASNSVKVTVELVSELTRLRPFFEFMLSNEDVERPKPAPDIYHLAINRLGLQPRQCLVIEDSRHGIKSAEDAGTVVMAVESVDDVSYDTVIAHVRQADRAS